MACSLSEHTLQPADRADIVAALWYRFVGMETENPKPQSILKLEENRDNLLGKAYLPTTIYILRVEMNIVFRFLRQSARGRNSPNKATRQTHAPTQSAKGIN